MIFSSLDLSSNSGGGGGGGDPSKPNPVKHHRRSSQTKSLNEFTNDFLKPDIVLVLKIIAANVNGLVVSELVKHLWETFLRSKADKSGISQDPHVNNVNDEDDFDEEDNKTALFPLNRQPVSGSDSDLTKPEMTGPVKRAIGFKGGNNDDDKNNNNKPTDTVTSLKTVNKPTSSATTSIV